MKDTAIYIHIPFCDHKCIYCDFYSIITTDNISSYKEALIKEINLYATLYSEESRIITIYFGGGTHADLLQVRHAQRVLRAQVQRMQIVRHGPRRTICI